MNTLVVAPHPDDETLGCGGTLFRRKSEGASLIWVIVTSVSESLNWSEQEQQNRDNEIKRVSKSYGFKDVYELGLPSAELDTIPKHEIINSFSKIVSKSSPNEIFLPFYGDSHSDHSIIAECMNSALKWSNNSPLSIYSYETLSETEMGNGIKGNFVPNVYIDISKYLSKKIKTMSIYENQLGQHPFPRSSLSIESLAYLRGSTIGVKAAEAFSLVKQII